MMSINQKKCRSNMIKNKKKTYLTHLFFAILCTSCQHDNFDHIILSKEYVVNGADTVCVRWITKDSVPFGPYYIYGENKKLYSLNCYNDNGASEGVAITYNADEKANSLRTLVNSVPNGPVIHFHHNGNINSYINYKKGLRVGPGFRYNEAGELTDFVLCNDFGNTIFSIQYFTDSVLISGDPIDNESEFNNRQMIKIDSDFVSTSLFVPCPPYLELNILYKWDTASMTKDYISVLETRFDSYGNLILPTPGEQGEYNLFLILTYSFREDLEIKYSYAISNCLVVK